MNQQQYECNSCAYKLWLEPKEGKTPSCPNCRATVYKAEYAIPEESTRHECGECEAVFFIAADADYPYKCPFCNFTFPEEPDRTVSHRL